MPRGSSFRRDLSGIASRFARFRYLRAAVVGLALQGAAASDHVTPALWRIRSGETTVYLFGSMHILPQGFTWTTKPIHDAMVASDLFLFEVPVGENALAEEKNFLVENGLLPRRQSLRGMLSPMEFETYTSVMRAAGIQSGAYERYRPWLASLVVGLAYLHPDNLTTLSGADDELMRFAQERSRQVFYLEYPRQQLELLTAAPESAQLTGLKNLISRLPQSRNLEQSLRAAWASGDSELLASLIDEAFRGRPDAQDFLIGRRNRLWMRAIDPVLRRPGVAMVTVGAAHIGGDGGLIDLICREGYAVERVLNDGGSAGACPAATAQSGE